MTEANAADHRHITYLCLQPRKEGQASFIHVQAIVDGLREIGWHVDLVEASPDVSRSAVRRLFGVLWTQARGLASLYRCDLVYVRNHFAAWPTVMLGRLMGKVVVIEVNGTHSDVFSAWPPARRFPGSIVWLSRSQLRHADGIIAVTEELARWSSMESGVSNVAVVPNGADTDKFAPVASNERSRYVAFVGALAAWQGVETMIQAAARPEWPTDVKLVIAGDGQLRRRCEEADSQGILRYLGPVPYANVPGLMARSLATLSVQSPTADRGQTGVSPVKLFEGLASGRPVIVSDLPGQGPLVTTTGSGVAIPPNDPAALAEAVRMLASSPSVADRMARRAREVAVSEHSWQARAGETSAFLGSTLRARTSGRAKSRARSSGVDR